jgi:hypothetical protein
MEEEEGAGPDQRLGHLVPLVHTACLVLQSVRVQNFLVLSFMVEQQGETLSCADTELQVQRA